MVDSAGDWLDKLLVSVHERNQHETDRFIRIYQSNSNLWRKSLYLDSRREEVKQRLAILEHETNELVKAGNHQTAVVNFMTHLTAMHPLLLGFEHSKALQEPTNFTKVIYDQKKELIYKQEELHMVKDALQETISKCVKLETEVNAEREQQQFLQNELDKLRRQNEEQDQKITELKTENDELINRYIEEKLKNSMPATAVGDPGQTATLATPQPPNLGIVSSRYHHSPSKDRKIEEHQSEGLPTRILPAALEESLQSKLTEGAVDEGTKDSCNIRPAVLARQACSHGDNNGLSYVDNEPTVADETALLSAESSTTDYAVDLDAERKGPPTQPPQSALTSQPPQGVMNCIFQLSSKSQAAISSIAATPNGAAAAGADAVVRLIDIASKHKIAKQLLCPAPVLRLDMIDIKPSTPIHEVSTLSSSTSLSTASPSASSTSASASAGLLLALCADGNLCVWNTRSGKQLHQLPCPRDKRQPLQCSWVSYI